MPLIDNKFSGVGDIYSRQPKTQPPLIIPETEYIRESPIRQSANRITLLNAPSIRETTKPLINIKERQNTETRQGVRLITEQAQKQNQIQEQISLQRQETAQRQTLRERLIERAKAPPKTKTPIVTLGRLKERETPKQQPKYTLFVKSKGIFNRVYETENKEEAFRKGEVLTDITASASFKVTQDNQALPSATFNPRYRESKKLKNVFVEKEKYRISTPREKREITFLGIQKNKRRF